MRRSFRLFLILLSLATCSLLTADNKLQDPTRPPAFATPKIGEKVAAQLRLSEIRITSVDKQVVINGKRLRVGNRIANYQLKKIAVGYVVLVNEKGTLRLSLINSRIIRKNL